MSRIQITREDFVASFIKVDKAPTQLTTKLEKPPFCHLFSKYVIRPVACDEQPFLIQHKNRQPVIVSQKKNPRRPKANEVTNFDDDSDEDFEKVVTDKKRAKGHGLGAATTVPQAEVNPQFPASDPSRVIVIPPKDKKKVEEQPPSKAAIVRNSDAKPKKAEEPTAPAEPKASEVIKRAVPAKKAEPAKKAAAQPATAAKVAADIEHAAMMKAMFAGSSAEAQAPAQTPAQAPPAKEAAAATASAKRPKAAKQQPKKNEGEEQKQEQAKTQAQAKPQSAAPKKEKKGGKKEESKGGNTEKVSLEALLSAEEVQYKQQATLVKKVKEEAKRVDQNDFAAAFGAAASLDQEQDRLKKVGRAARAAKKN